jgi:dipeptidyl aminopeptidase/acylaminoacyl peptidase
MIPDPRPLIPRRILFADPDRAHVTVSPDGAWLAWLAPHRGVLNIWLAPRQEPAAARPLTDFHTRGLGDYQWAADSRHLLWRRDRDGDEQWHLHALDISDGSVRDLTPFDGVLAFLVAISPDHPDSVLIGLNRRDRTMHDLYRVALADGALTLVAESDNFLDWIVDRQLRVRGATRMTEAGETAWLWHDGAGWVTGEVVSSADSLTTAPLAFSAAGDTLFLRDSRGRDTAALVAREVATGGETVLAEAESADTGDILWHPVHHTPQAVSFTAARQRWQLLDPDLAPHFAALHALGDGELHISARSRDQAWWIVALERDDGPRRYWLYEAATRQATFLFSNQAALDGLPLAPMRVVTIPARDGLTLTGYLTLPPGGEGERHPLVLLPHGGPWWRDFWGYNGWHQWLANRGYAALSVNFRGSTGLGKAFLNAGDREWGGAILHDLLDAVAWAVASGSADSDRLAIMGGSFGGYATLAALAFAPDRFACGIDLFGPSSLETLLATVPPYWKPMFELLAQRVGDPRTEEGVALLRAHSPLHRAGAIVRPLLIGQGGNDVRVKSAESEQLVASLRGQGIPVTYAYYPDEGHGFARPANRFSFHALAEQFLADHLGGRAEPPGEDGEGSSLQLV